MATAADWWDDRVDGVPRIPVGEWVEEANDWITEHLGDALGWFSDRVDSIVTDLIDLLTAPEPLVMAAVFALLAWLARDWKLGIGTFLGMALIISMEQWDNAMNTLALIVVAALICLLIGIPLGIMAARWDGFSSAIRPILDLMQTMPAMFWLIPAVVLFSIGIPAGIVATIIFALPPGVRLTELGIRQVDAEVVEAGHAFGATPRQILREVQLPLAMPTVMAGVNQVIMLALSMAVMAGFVGAGGLGGEVIAAITQIQIGLGFEAGFSVVILAIFLDRVTAAAGNTSPGRGRIRELYGRVGGRRTERDTEDVAEGAAEREGAPV
ncbi:ABC transporter permease [Solicola gregarius]|uniref:ABC transporter permease subunit n=1 Tax=Solicola gregarius TaxID=2908642 RepID=A0AA46TFY3_9ACTN|nr:ABC transporter permease subunit [Solicola gregarius]UYM04386.1 ABC transporter permease subunit [Solicola gregarius]